MNLYYLGHPGSKMFSGYGLKISHNVLIGFLMVDRPTPVSLAWLIELKATFGDFTLTPMTSDGDRGILCQMVIAPDSWKYLREIDGPLSDSLASVLMLFTDALPAVKLALSWDPDNRQWQSKILESEDNYDL